MVWKNKNMKTNEYLSSALEKLHSKNDDFIIFGMTGRTGSGCTYASEMLSKEKIEHSLFSGTQPQDNIQRKQRILIQHYNKNWQAFIHLKVTSILTQMLLDIDNEATIKDFLKAQDYIRNSDVDFIIDQLVFYKNEKTKCNTSKLYTEILPAITNKIKQSIEDVSFIKLYQLLGKNARRSGCVTDSKIKNGMFFTVAEKIKIALSNLRKEDKENRKNTYIVIDAIRNPLEASYFQERYSSFYLIAISCSEATRSSRLKAKGLSQESIDNIDKNEYSSLDIDDERSFTDQDIQGCLQKADIYINSGDESEVSIGNQLIKFVCLAQKPGIITPSAEERCMQIAYTAKLNSGCLSRKVGAVITKNNYSIKAVGWNDTPYGQVPCNLRSMGDLKNDTDQDAYSPFERNNSTFKERISTRSVKFQRAEQKGYNISFCFKSEYNSIKKDKNQVHTRSLHAEENAFLQLSKDGGTGIEGGFLFTTASPCELCAKKAYQLGIKRIFYIDPYPGISFEHILSAGRTDLQPHMKLFHGAIGRAFHNLYNPISSYKDELNALAETDE